MAKLIFGMQQSLDGYVDHLAMGPPAAPLYQHFVAHVRGLTGMIYGRHLYEIMRYWDDEHPDWNADSRAFAVAWRQKQKWVVSRTLESVGPNAQLLEGDLEAAIRQLKAQQPGELDVAGPTLAASLTKLGLIDEYRLYLRPLVLGRGMPFFVGPRPPLRLVSDERIGEAMRLTYVPA